MYSRMVTVSANVTDLFSWLLLELVKLLLLLLRLIEHWLVSLFLQSSETNEEGSCLSCCDSEQAIVLVS